MSEKNVKFKRSKEPYYKNSFGHALWLILGGKEAHISQAAQLLGITSSQLSAIIHGYAKALQPVLLEKNWRSILSQHYPEAWQQHQARFEQYASKLKTDPKTGVKEPHDKKSFSYVLWLILGGTHANLTQAANLLDVPPTYPSLIIHGRMKISQQLTTQKKWQSILEQHYPETWKQHGKTFNRRLKTLPLTSADIRKQSLEKASEKRAEGRLKKKIHKEWCLAVGTFVDRVLKINGDDIADIVGDIDDRLLKQEFVWKEIRVGNPRWADALYKKAIEEICRLYNLPERRDGLYDAAKRLLEACPTP